MGGDDNTNISKIIKTENAVEIKFPRDFIILGEMPETTLKSKYQE